MQLAAELRHDIYPTHKHWQKWALRPGVKTIVAIRALKNDTHKSNGFWMPLRSAAISRVLGLGFPPPLNPAVENATSTLRTDTDSNESWDLAHETISVISAVKTHTYKSDGTAITLMYRVREEAIHMWTIEGERKNEIITWPNNLVRDTSMNAKINGIVYIFSSPMVEIFFAKRNRVADYSYRVSGL